jgi:DNA-binding MarR family transcriptional regulator
MPSDTVDIVNLDLAHFVPYRLSVLSNRVSSAIARTYADRFDLTIPEWRCIAVLGGAPGLSAGDVAQRTAMDKVQVSRAIARLVENKRVARVVDAADGRVARLSLSAKGRAIYDEVAPLALELEAKFLDALSPAERASLDRIMTKLNAQVGLLAE